jgi:hypothetical protein
LLWLRWRRPGWRTRKLIPFPPVCAQVLARCCCAMRNLSEQGRQQARGIGQWFQAQGLQPHAARCSAWCRCIDTAELAFGQHQLWSALNSLFGAADAQTLQSEQSARLRAALGGVPAGQFEV